MCMKGIFRYAKCARVCVCVCVCVWSKMILARLAAKRPDCRMEGLARLIRSDRLRSEPIRSIPHLPLLLLLWRVECYESSAAANWHGRKRKRCLLLCYFVGRASCLTRRNICRAFESIERPHPVHCDTMHCASGVITWTTHTAGD